MLWTLRVTYRVICPAETLVVKQTRGPIGPSDEISLTSTTLLASTTARSACGAFRAPACHRPRRPVARNTKPLARMAREASARAHPIGSDAPALFLEARLQLRPKPDSELLCWHRSTKHNHVAAFSRITPPGIPLNPCLTRSSWVQISVHVSAGAGR